MDIGDRMKGYEKVSRTRMTRRTPASSLAESRTRGRPGNGRQPYLGFG